jgi:5-formyltetrahydrofolate cyclo-ligase
VTYSMPSLQDQKRLLRAEMRDIRRENASNNLSLFNKLAEVFARGLQLEKEAVVSSYCAFRDEMNPAPLAEALRAQGHRIVLPVVVGKREPLTFRLYQPGDELVKNFMGIREPVAAAPAVEPDILLVPLLAFDRQRNRLGYGGGYYDRTMASLRTRKPVLALGIAYAYQEVSRIPVGPNDIRLDKIVTELGIV